MIIRHNTLVSLDRVVDSKYHNSLSKRPGTYFKISAKNDEGLFEGGRLVKESANLIILSAYYLHGKPGESGENSNGTVHPGRNFPEKKVIPFEVLPFPVFTKTTEIFLTICLDYYSARLHVERKRKIYRYFVNGTTQSRSCFRCPKKIPVQAYLGQIIHFTHTVINKVVIETCFTSTLLFRRNWWWRGGGPLFEEALGWIVWPRGGC